jgi:outer membrane biosynthesis protein TonB
MILQIKTNKGAVDIFISDAPVEKPKDVVAKQKPQPKIVPPAPKPKPQPKPQPKVEEKPSPSPPEVKPAPSLGSLFSKIDTTKFSNEAPKPREEKPIVSSEAVSRIKQNITKTETPVEKREDGNISSEMYRVNRQYSYNYSQSVSVDYKELEITSSSLQSSDSGVYDKIFSQIQGFLHTKWYPSSEVAGNSAKVRLILNENSVVEHFKIILEGKSPEFNMELRLYLESMIGERVPVELKDNLKLEVWFRAKD